MQILTFSYKNRTPSVGILRDDQVVGAAWRGDMQSLIASGVTPATTSERYPLADVTIKAPLRPGKVIAIGRNYAAHAKELGGEAPDEPYLFSIFGSSVIGHGQAITWRESVTTQVDWEGELAVVIGKKGYRITEENALVHVFGYTVGNDVSARDLQSNDEQWIRAKGLDTFCPLGPYVTLRNAVDDPQALNIKTEVNGEVMQDGNTGDMVHPVAKLIAYVSRYFTLEPGDVLLTGTPSGVGKGMNPPRFLKDGDTVSVTIDGLGTLTNPCQVLADE